MNKECTLQLFLDGAWQDAAVFTLTGPAEQGWQAASYTGYLLDHAIAWPDKRDAHACSQTFPVSLQDLRLPTWPAFMMDLLPQGYGRQELLRQLDLPARAEQGADWPLLLAGAGNPIGNMRVKEAADWLARQEQGVLTGFTVQQVASRDESFLEHLAQHGLFVAGSSGVQGEWPKILLTEADDGLLYLDHTLPDAHARRHWLVKFSRGQNADLAAILEAEAPYMELARHLGLRVHAPLERHERSLFIPRFDREVRDGKVMRHAQESLASLCQRPGFGVALTHNQVCRVLAAAVCDPEAEIIEYLKRDVVNVALGNKDNHARNTAVQRRADGHIALTPLYDFAPMWLHPDGIARQLRWEQQDGGQPDWAAAIRQAAEAADLPEPPLRQALAAMAPALEQLPALMQSLAISPALVECLQPVIRQIAGALHGLN